MATPAVDQTYGQRSVFGVLGHGATATATAPVDDDLDCEDEHDALAYLMLVRSEASRIPHVMVAPRPGPQAFPPGYAEHKEKKAAAREARRQRSKRRQRHWDDQGDGGDGVAAKRQRTAQLSYDEVSYDEPAGEVAEAAQIEEEEDDDDDACDYHRQALYETGVGDARGYYDDGAYVAAEEVGDGDGRANDGAGDGAGDAAFSAAYRARLLAHFAELRAHLAALDMTETEHETETETEVGPLSVRSGVFRHWLQVLRTTDPRAAQVAAMDKVSVLRLLRIVQRGLEAGASTSSRTSRAGRFVRSLVGAGGGGGGGGGGAAGTLGTLDMGARTTRWLWALLARLPGGGELDYREVGYVRDVAKQAVMRLAHLSYDMSGGGDAGAEDAVEEDAELDAEDIAMDIDSEADETDAGAARTGADLDDSRATTATAATAATAATTATTATAATTATTSDETEMQQRAALEMVLAVAGEFYGQRDLLAFRSPWPAAAADTI